MRRVNVLYSVGRLLHSHLYAPIVNITKLLAYDKVQACIFHSVLPLVEGRGKNIGRRLSIVSKKLSFTIEIDHVSNKKFQHADFFSPE